MIFIIKTAIRNCALPTVRLTLSMLFSAVLISGNSSAQSDSVFLKSQIKPLTGKAIVNHHRHTVSITGENGKQAVNFSDIAVVTMRSGKHYIAKSLTEGASLTVLLVKGRYSLLFNEGNKLFYIERNDSMLVISQQHMVRALPLIFGDKLLTAYHIKSNIKPQYSAHYLKNLTVYANESLGSEAAIFEENLNQFKTSVYIGPYIAYGYNRTALDLMITYEEGLVAYRKTNFASSNSIPLGIRTGVQLSRKIGISLSAFINRTTAENTNLDSTDHYPIPFPQSLLISGQEKTNLKSTGFSHTAIHLDLSMTVFLARNEQNRFKPYVFAGPTLAFLTKSEILQAAGYRQNPQAETSYAYIWSKLNRKQYLVGFNSGLGLDYSVSSRMNLNASAKFSGGIYPKIRNTSITTKFKNDTPVASKYFETFVSGFSNTYDQYMRLISIGISAAYKL